jgi:hypothetical protein
LKNSPFNGLLASFTKGLTLVSLRAAHSLSLYSSQLHVERIADQKHAVKTLVVLYRNSSDIPGRTDTMRDGQTMDKRASMNPKKFFKKASQAVRFAATTTATGFGNVASEIMGR